jgi:hypothetical protein
MVSGVSQYKSLRKIEHPMIATRCIIPRATAIDTWLTDNPKTFSITHSPDPDTTRIEVTLLYR